MKHNYLKHLFTALLLLCTTVVTAHNFEVGGIYYNILSKTDKTVEVTCKGSSYSHYSNEYSGSVVIPETVTYNETIYTVISIEDYAFSYCSELTSVVIGNSVTIIEHNAFNGCTGLRSIVIGNSVTSIGVQTFNACKKLTEIKIPNNVTSIGEYAFSYCSGLTSIEIGTCIGNEDSVTSIGNYAFYGCTGLTSVVFGNNVTSIGNYVFSGCTSLESVKILNSATNIGNKVFGGSSPKKVELNCDTISSWLSRNTSIEEIIIGNSVTSIGEDAFYECTGLTSVTIPNSVTSIGSEAFRGCSGLTSVVIGNSVTSIGSSAFKSCTGLKSVTSLIPADALFAIAANVFANVNKNTCTLYVPAGAGETYAATTGWNEFANIVELDPSEITITINQYGCATYCSLYALDFSEVEGLKAYSAIGFNSSTQVVTLARVMTTPAEAGIFVKGEPGEYTVPIVEECNEHTLNLLVGTLEQTTVNSTEGEMSNYKFTVAELDEVPMFYPFEDNTTFSAGKAYLQIPTAWLPATAQKSLSVRFDEGETTEIDEVEDENEDVKTVYDLQGRVVENPTSGIYIINGKKVVVK